MDMDVDLPEKIDVHVSCSQTLLLEGEVVKIRYPLRLTKLCYESNSKVINGLLRQKANMYALWTKKPSSNDWTLMYIGHHTHHYMRSHLRHHFFKKPERILSQLPKIKRCLLDGYEIGVSVAYTQPDEVKYAVEQLVIVMKEQDLCEWNIIHT